MQSARHIELYRRRVAQRDESYSNLLAFLGGKCAECGTRGTRKNPLEVNHINGRDWNLQAVASWVRVARYWEEARAGLVNLLCKRDNGRDGAQRRYA